VRLLLNKGADINAKDKDDQTALHRASYDKVVRLLLNKGADINAKDKYGNTALHNASDRGKDKVVRLLLNKGADINAKDKYGQTALHIASGSGKDEVVSLLLQHASQKGMVKKLLNATNQKGERAVDLARKGTRKVLESEMKKHGLKI
jgi:ankyrin repeat protein